MTQQRDIKKLLFDLIDADRDMLVQDLQKLIQIPSVSEDTEKVKEALQYTLNLGASMNFKSESRSDDRVGLIEMGEGSETLGILTHVDVVPVEPLSDWTKAPFAAEISDGKVFGRGALDDKGMVIASLYAMKAVRDLGFELKKKVQMIIGSQEEVSWEDMYDYVKRYELPDYGFTPDGEFPVQNVEKGVCDLLLEFDVSEAKAERESPVVVSINAGTVSNCVPGRAEAVLSNGEIIRAEGKVAHSSVPSRGINAIFELRSELKKRGIKENIFTKVLDMLYEEVGDNIGRKMPFYKEDEYYQGEFVHRNVFIPTVVKTQDGKMSVLVDIRYVIGTSEDDLINYFSELAKRFGGTVVVNDLMKPVFVSREKPFLKSFAKAYETVTGVDSGFKTAYGASYAKTMPNFVAWGPVFPDEPDTCHEADEFIYIDSLIKCTKIYACAIADIALSELSFK